MMVHLNQEDCYSRTMLRAADLIGLHQQKILEETGMSNPHRRTIPREKKKQVSSGTIPYAVDKDGEYVYMRDGPIDGAANARRLGYKCPFCGFGMSTSSQNSVLRVAHWAHFQNNPNQCSFQLNRDNIATSLDEGKLQQRKSNHLNLILKKEGFAPWKLLTNGDNYHGFPVDESMRMSDFNSDNLSLRAGSSVMDNWWRKNFTNDVAPNLIVNDWEKKVSAAVRYPNHRLKTMAAPGINFGDVFVFGNPDSLYAERVRPSAICKNPNDKIIIKEHTFIGIVAHEENTYPKIQYEKKFRLRKDLPYFIEIYDLSNQQHAKQLESRKIVMKKSNSERAAVLEVLIRSPIHAHPKNPEMVFLSSNEELVLLVDHHNNEKQLYADIVNRPSGNESALGNPADYFGENWTISTHKKGNLGRENLQVQSNAYQDMRKPSRGITIKTHDIHSVENTEIEGVHVSFNKYTGNGTSVDGDGKYQIFSNEPIELDYFPTDITFSSPLKSLSNLDIFDVEVIVNGKTEYSKKAVNVADYLRNTVYSDYSIEDVVENIRKGNSNYDKIERIEIGLNQVKTGYSGDTLPKIVIDIVGSYEEIASKIEQERLAEEERIAREKERERERQEAAERKRKADEKALRDAQEAAELEKKKIKERERQREEAEERRKLHEQFDSDRIPQINILVEHYSNLKSRFSQLPTLMRQRQRGPVSHFMRKIESSLSKARKTYVHYELERHMAEVNSGLNDFRRILELEEKQVKAELKEFQEKASDRIKAVEDEYEKALSKWEKSLPKRKYDETPFSEVRTHLEKCRNCPSNSALDREISLTMKLIEELEAHTKYYIDYHAEHELGGAEREKNENAIKKKAKEKAEKKVKEEAEKKVKEEADRAKVEESIRHLRAKIGEDLIAFEDCKKQYESIEAEDKAILAYLFNDASCRKLEIKFKTLCDSRKSLDSDFNNLSELEKVRESFIGELKSVNSELEKIKSKLDEVTIDQRRSFLIYVRRTKIEEITKYLKQANKTLADPKKRLKNSKRQNINSDIRRWKKEIEELNTEIRRIKEGVMHYEFI